MNAILILFLIGVLLLAGEVFVPGAVLGIIGAICMLGGCVLAFVNFGTAGGLLATGIAVVLLVLMLYVELYWLPRTKMGKNMIVQSKVDQTSQPPLAELDAVLGKTAEALTPLMPSGYVLVEGKRYEAYSQSGHVPKGAVMRVTGLDNFRLILTKS